MPAGWQPRPAQALRAAMGNPVGQRAPHILASPPGTAAPIGAINYTPATGEIHHRGVLAPVDQLNYSLLPAEGAGGGFSQGMGMGAGTTMGPMPQSTPGPVVPFRDRSNMGLGLGAGADGLQDPPDLNLPGQTAEPTATPGATATATATPDTSGGQGGQQKSLAEVFAGVQPWQANSPPPGFRTEGAPNDTPGNPTELWWFDEADNAHIFMGTISGGQLTMTDPATRAQRSYVGQPGNTIKELQPPAAAAATPGTSGGGTPDTAAAAGGGAPAGGGTPDTSGGGGGAPAGGGTPDTSGGGATLVDPTASLDGSAAASTGVDQPGGTGIAPGSILDQAAKANAATAQQAPSGWQTQGGPDDNPKKPTQLWWVSNDNKNHLLIGFIVYSPQPGTPPTLVHATTAQQAISSYTLDANGNHQPIPQLQTAAKAPATKVLTVDPKTGQPFADGLAHTMELDPKTNDYTTDKGPAPNQAGATSTKTVIDVNNKYGFGKNVSVELKYNPATRDWDQPLGPSTTQPRISPLYGGTAGAASTNPNAPQFIGSSDVYIPAGSALTVGHGQRIVGAPAPAPPPTPTPAAAPTPKPSAPDAAGNCPPGTTPSAPVQSGAPAAAPPGVPPAATPTVPTGDVGGGWAATEQGQEPFTQSGIPEGSARVPPPGGGHEGAGADVPAWIGWNPWQRRPRWGHRPQRAASAATPAARRATRTATPAANPTPASANPAPSSANLPPPSPAGVAGTELDPAFAGAVPPMPLTTPTGQTTQVGGTLAAGMAGVPGSDLRLSGAAAPPTKVTRASGATDIIQPGAGPTPFAQSDLAEGSSRAIGAGADMFMGRGLTSDTGRGSTGLGYQSGWGPQGRGWFPGAGHGPSGGGTRGGMGGSGIGGGGGVGQDVGSAVQNFANYGPIGATRDLTNAAIRGAFTSPVADEFGVSPAAVEARRSSGDNVPLLTEMPPLSQALWAAAHLGKAEWDQLHGGGAGQEGPTTTPPNVPPYRPAPPPPDPSPPAVWPAQPAGGWTWDSAGTPAGVPDIGELYDAEIALQQVPGQVAQNVQRGASALGARAGDVLSATSGGGDVMGALSGRELAFNPSAQLDPSQVQDVRGRNFRMPKPAWRGQLGGGQDEGTPVMPPPQGLPSGAPAGPTGPMAGGAAPQPGASPSPGPGWTPPVSPQAVAGIGHRFGQPMNVGEPQHTGVDLQAPEGTGTISPVDGMVERVENNPQGLGLTVVIRGKDGSEHRLGHLSHTAAYPGMQVARGQDLQSKVGSSGNATGSHLHWGVRDPQGQPVDNTGALPPQMQNMPPVPGTEMMGPPGGVGSMAQQGPPPGGGMGPPAGGPPPVGGGQEQRAGWAPRAPAAQNPGTSVYAMDMGMGQDTGSQDYKAGYQAGLQASKSPGTPPIFVPAMQQPVPSMGDQQDQQQQDQQGMGAGQTVGDISTDVNHPITTDPTSGQKMYMTIWGPLTLQEIQDDLKTMGATPTGDPVAYFNQLAQAYQDGSTPDLGGTAGTTGTTTDPLTGGSLVLTPSQQASLEQSAATEQLRAADQQLRQLMTEGNTVLTAQGKAHYDAWAAQNADRLQLLRDILGNSYNQMLTGMSPSPGEAVGQAPALQQLVKDMLSPYQFPSWYTPGQTDPTGGTYYPQPGQYMPYPGAPGTTGGIQYDAYGNIVSTGGAADTSGGVAVDANGNAVATGPGAATSAAAASGGPGYYHGTMQPGDQGAAAAGPFTQPQPDLATWNSWTPWQKNSYIANAQANQLYGGPTWPQTQQGVTQGWGGQSAADVTQMQAGAASPEEQVGQAMTGNFVGMSTPQWQARQGGQWSAARAPTIKQQFTGIAA